MNASMKVPSMKVPDMIAAAVPSMESMGKATSRPQLDYDRALLVSQDATFNCFNW